MQARQVDLSDMQSKVLAWLQKKMPQAQNLSMSALERPSIGYSNETFLFDLSWQEAGQQRSKGMVLRSAPKSMPVFPKYDLGLQFHIMRLLKGTDIPVPNVLWLEEDESILGATFYMMDKLDGIVPSDVPSYHTAGPYFDATPEQRAKFWWGSLEAMAKIHLLDWKSLGIDFISVPGGGTDPIDRQLNYWEEFLNWGKEDPALKEPILDASLDWLKKNRYTPEHVTLCWGDTRMGNTMYDKDFNPIGIFDWEMAYIGDHESDLCWFFLLDYFHSDGSSIPRLEGTPSREESVQRYEEWTGWKIKNLFYNDVLAAFRFAVILYKIFKNFASVGAPRPTGDSGQQNNVCTQRLASLLHLPPPGPPPSRITRIEDVTVTVQLHLTGPGGSDWYLVADHGKGTRYEGTADNPDVTVTVSAEDWAAIQSGEMTRSTAWMGGKLNIEGNQALYRQLEDMTLNM